MSRGGEPSAEVTPRVPPWGGRTRRGRRAFRRMPRCYDPRLPMPRRHERRPRRRRLPPPLAVALLLSALFIAALLVCSCRLPIQRGRWNVVVVLVDTLRADHLGAYGYG